MPGFEAADDDEDDDDAEDDDGDEVGQPSGRRTPLPVLPLFSASHLGMSFLFRVTNVLFMEHLLSADCT
jgi:hypothetical protein